jgi:pantothenate kinase
VIIEGLYVLLDQEPWDLLKKEIFTLTYFLNTPLEKTKERLMLRLQTEMGLSEEEAEIRANGNDLVNAIFIKNNTDLS